MNLTLDVDMLEINNFFFLETKQNVIIDGTFTKLIYSDSSLVLNGIYIHVPFVPYNIYKNNNKTTFYISPINSTNMNIIGRICDFEYRLMNKFKEHSGGKKRIIYSIQEQLKSLCFKTFREGGYDDMSYTHTLRISGIWETNTAIGLTFRFNSTTQLYPCNVSVES